MNDIKLFLTDLDGTLLHDDHLTVSDRTRRALQALQDRGIPLCACTGRVLCTLPPAIAEIGFDYAITSNGAACTDLHTGETVFTAYLSAQRAETAWRLLEPTGCMTEWFVRGDILMDRDNYAQWPERLRARWHRVYLSAGGGIVVDDIHDFFAQGAPGLEKISVFDCPPDTRRLAIDPMLALGDYEISTSLGYNFEITDISADKGRALRSLCSHLGISPAEAIAFGDGGNDQKFLSAAGVSVAMGNAIDALKASTSAITLTNEEDGVADYLERHLLNP